MSFSFRDRARTRPQSYCRDCTAAYHRAYYRRNRRKHIERINAHRRGRIAANREIVARAKKVPCADCRACHPPYVMDFDHVTPGKLGDISKLVYTAPTSVLKDEIAKCEVVCANCHRERTHMRRAEPPVASD